MVRDSSKWQSGGGSGRAGRGGSRGAQSRFKGAQSSRADLIIWLVLCGVAFAQVLHRPVFYLLLLLVVVVRVREKEIRGRHTFRELVEIASVWRGLRGNFDGYDVVDR